VYCCLFLNSDWRQEEKERLRVLTNLHVLEGAVGVTPWCLLAALLVVRGHHSLESPHLPKPSVPAGSETAFVSSKWQVPKNAATLSFFYSLIFLIHPLTCMY
jgi:hypothetical protein